MFAKFSRAMCALFAAGVFLSLAAQEAPARPGKAATDRLSQRLGDLNREVLLLDAEADHSDGPARSQTITRAQEKLRERAETLRALIRDNPAEALRQSFAPDAIRKLESTFPEAAGLLESHGVWHGPVHTRVFDGEDLRSHKVIHRVEIGGETLEIHMAGIEPGSVCGDTVEFEGVRSGPVVAASRSKVLSSGPSRCGPVGEQRIIVLLVTFPGVAAPLDVTPEIVRGAFFGGAGRSLDGYWREASYGKTSATGDVRGWYTLDAGYTCSQSDQLLAAAIAAADADVDFLEYNRIFLIFPNPGGCGLSGISDIGCFRYNSSADGSFFASATWLLSSFFTSVEAGAKLLAHEAGHALGLQHSRSRAFNGEPLGAPGELGTFGLYGDVHSAMGNWNFGHYAAPQKSRLGWQENGSNVVTVETAGSYLIQPTESPSASAQTLKVRRGTGGDSWLWVEYRQPIGDYDSTLSPQAFTGALIHYEDSITLNYTDLLDFRPGTVSFADAALEVGQTWSDPYSNLSLSIQSATPSGLMLTVGYGAVPCAHASPGLVMSPASTSVYAGATVSHTVTVTNHDSAGCASRTFHLDSMQPSGWGTAFSSSALALAPGESASVTMSKSVPTGAAPSTYTVNATATAGSSTASASANVTVMAPPPLLSLTPSVGSSSYPPRATVAMTARLLSGTSPLAGVRVDFLLRKPDGATVARGVNTDSTGTAAWNYRLGLKDPSGNYSLTVSATYQTQTAAGGPVTFTVQ